jgi:hypothetical protein
MGKGRKMEGKSWLGHSSQVIWVKAGQPCPATHTVSHTIT